MQPSALSPGLTVLERGWLSSNNVVVHEPGDPDGPAVLIDSGHCVHAEQTLALVNHTLQGRRLERVINTHLHSDHCGGNAALQAAFENVPVFVPPGQAQAVLSWDEDALSYRPTGQRCERWVLHGVVRPGERLRLGAQDWQVLAAPGHDPHAVMLWRAADGVLIAGDALWENGYGVVFPELDGIAAFDEVEATLDLIERLPVRWVIPGHGSPFRDLQGALQRARRRLAGQRAEPRKHALHAAKVLVKYHLMEERTQALNTLRTWALATPLMARCQERAGDTGTLADFVDHLIDDLLSGGALRRVGDRIHDT